MDTYENDQLRHEQDDTQSPTVFYNSAGKGRKESPFADSPYVMEPQTIPVAKEQRNGGNVWKGLLAAAMVLVLVISCCAATAMVVNERWEDRIFEITSELNDRVNDLQIQLDNNSNAIDDINSGVGVIPGGTGTTADGYLTPGQVYAKNAKSVVMIRSQSNSGGSSGSGFIMTADGYVITNQHVVEGGTAISVITYDGQEMEAKLVGADATNDIALLKVDAQDLPAAAIGSSDALHVGDQVVAIGNPLGELTSTMTVGYVSAKDRDVTTDGGTINMIQTDAAINSGNSGGPLFNMKGEVVGITTAKYSGATASGATIEGIGFAIPMDDVIGMIKDLKEHGYITGAYLGVMVRSVDSEISSMYGLPMGSYVESVTKGSCAETAGIRAKDIIIAMGGYEITGNTDLTRTLRKFKAGDTTTITVYRGGKQVELTITFDEKPHDTAQDTTQPAGQNQMPSNGSYEEWYNYFAPFFGNGNDKD